MAFTAADVKKLSEQSNVGMMDCKKALQEADLNVLNDLKSRGVLDVYLFCTDGLCGMMQAIQAVYPHSRLQRCIVHQIRSSTRQSSR